MKTVNLKPGTPKDDAFIQEIKELVRKNVKLENGAFESKWQRVTHDFHGWRVGPYGSNTSQHNNQLDFLQRLCEAFPDANLLSEKQIIDRMLSEVRPIGETFEGRKPNGQTALLKVVHREITPRFGVNFILECEDGTRFTWEFFD